MAVQRSADLGRLWLSAEQRRILRALEDAVLHRGGLLVVTGDVGVGKTTLAQALVEELGDRAVVARLPHPSVDAPALIEILGRSLRIDTAGGSRTEFLRGVRELVSIVERQGKRVVILIDEAQDLTAGALGELEFLLTSLERRPSLSCLSLLLVGQDDLLSVLEDPARQFQRLMTLAERVPALGKGEVEEFVRHRLLASGAGTDLFTDDALRAIEELSGGIPRVADTLCDVAMMGRVAGEPIDARAVRERAQRFGVLSAFPTERAEPDTRTAAAPGAPVVARSVATRSVAARTKASSPSPSRPHRLWRAGVVGLAIGLAGIAGSLFISAGITWWTMTSPGTSRDAVRPRLVNPPQEQRVEPVPKPVPPPESLAGATGGSGRAVDPAPTSPEPVASPPPAERPTPVAEAPTIPRRSEAPPRATVAKPSPESPSRARSAKSSSEALPRATAAKPSPAKPSPAEPLPAQPSPAQPLKDTSPPRRTSPGGSSDATDPGAIIDWVLRDPPSRR